MKRLFLIFTAIIAIAVPRTSAAGHGEGDDAGRIDPKEIIF